MICVSAMYPATEGATFDHDYYRDKHMAMVREKLTPVGLVRADTFRGLADAAGGPAPMVAMAHMYFESMEVLQSAMTSPAVAELEADVANFTDIKAVTQISQVVE